MNINNSDIRDIFFQNYKKEFLKNNNNYILTNDAEVFALKSLKNHKRYIDAGVAEQNLINIAAGLSRNNKAPLVFGFCTFLTFRCYEQLKFNIGSHNQNVKVVGIGPGYSFSYDGPTHHGIQDICLMNLIPEFEVINISDNNLCNVVSKSLKKIKGPSYIRLDKGILNYNLEIKYDLLKGYEFTKKSKKQNLLLITTGYTNKIANEVFEEISQFDVINFFRLKNYDKKKIAKEISNYKKIIIYDENTYMGGIVSIIYSIIIKYKIQVEINHLTSPDKQIFLYSRNRDQLMDKLKIGKKDIRKLVLKNL